MKLKKLDCRINKQLYFDGLRQLKLVGIMGMVVFCAAAILTAVGYHINTRIYYEYDALGNIIRTYYKPVGVSLYACHWMLFASFSVLAPVMTTILFNFLNHRNASDFYHSIPDTRGTLYVSYIAAILTWLGAIIGVSTVLSVICISMTPGYFVIWSGVPKCLFIIVAACILVMGGTMIALGLTGTRMSNLLVAVMILFLPRIFVTVIMEMLEGMLNFVAWEYSPSLLNPRYNLIAGLPLSLFNGVNPLEYWSSGVYSLVLGLIYLAVGFVIFVRRKSESAGHAAITRRLQSVFRLAVSMTVCLVPIYFMVDSWASRYGWDVEDLFFMVVFYVIAVLAYFIYELMTTGKLRRFKKLCKGLLLLAALNVVAFLGIISIYQSVVNYQPDGEDIDYIMIIGDEDEYFESQLGRIKVRDNMAADITSTALARTIHYYTDDDPYNGMGYEWYESQNRYVTKKIAINEGMKTVYRKIRYTESEWNQIADCLSDMADYRMVFCDLPEYKANETTISSWRGALRDEQMVRVYEVMREEVLDVDFAEWYTAVTGGNYNQYIDVIYLYTEAGGGGIRRSVYLPIIPSMTRTLNAYFSELSSVEISENETSTWSEMSSAIRTGQNEKGEKVQKAQVTMTLNVIGGEMSDLYLYSQLEAYHDEDKWYVDGWGEASGDEPGTEWAETMLTFADNLFEGKYTFDQAGGVWLEVNLGGYVVYSEKDLVYSEKEELMVDRNFYISLSDPIPEEVKTLLGKYAEMLEVEK